MIELTRMLMNFYDTNQTFDTSLMTVLITFFISPRRIKFFEKHNPFNELAYLTSRQKEKLAVMNLS